MTLHEHLADPPTPPSLRPFLRALAPLPSTNELPPLYATTKRDFAGRTFAGEVAVVPSGVRVRVTDAGRFNDVGITMTLNELAAYQARAGIGELTDFSERP